MLQLIALFNYNVQHIYSCNLMIIEKYNNMSISDVICIHSLAKNGFYVNQILSCYIDNLITNTLIKTLKPNTQCSISSFLFILIYVLGKYKCIENTILSVKALRICSSFLFTGGINKTFYILQINVVFVCSLLYDRVVIG